ncbi:PR domain zinc finger protein 2 isoform X2 [Rattus rattus]|uniref:PR domain zinc finger protein 2 isoform X2 n=1 Tax=Rattus rattus TaxID=10117 RepID=UPI0013F38B4B|nr:PR domain zinc finger protein 2 isoform X2 [Rattus rattus]
MHQNTESVAATETLAEVPEHVLRGLPEEVRLFPSAVDKTRIGVWATKPILKGKKFGPFVGDKKKRSQVRNNVYMWEVYYPNLGWMCIDATDPEKGNWLRYVNWACSGEEQNLFPLEINRAIYYKTLKPIAPGEELLVWYNGEDNPEIAAAIEEERASARSKRSSPKSRRGKKKSHENKNKGIRTHPTQLKASELDSTFANMRGSAEGPKEEDERPVASAPEQPAPLPEVGSQDAVPQVAIPLPACEPRPEADGKQEVTDFEVNDVEEEEEEEEELEEEEEEELGEDGVEEADMPNESSAKEPEIRCEEKPEDLLEEPQSMSNETREDSPDVTPPPHTPRAREEANGDVLETFMFPCQHCERKFATKQGLERHMHIHISTINHAFKCKYCGKRFGTQINRRRHERRHETGLKRRPSMTLQSSEDPDDGKGENVTAKDESSPPQLGQDCLILNSEKTSQEVLNSSFVEENGEVKELHPCKYCKKVFGTHTNMRRHQRRVHERHLIPKGVRRKGGLLEEPQPPAEQAPPSQSVYVPSTEPEEEGETDDVYIMDISSNISENLNYYIDGKIQSNSSTSNCDVIEMESTSAHLYGIDCLLAPVTVEITQNIKGTQVSVTDDLLKDSPSSTNCESKKRRTASPPVLPKIKTETESDSTAPSCSLSLPLSISTAEVVSFHKEKGVYLSSKLKQLLQTQDKLTPPAGFSAAEIPKLGPVCASAPASMLPVTSSRFKRRTSSPPSSPQHSPALRDFGKPNDGKAAWTDTVLTSKKPKLESRSDSPAWSLSGRDERETGSPPCFDEYKISKEWAASSTFSSVCNQQPLDLSSGVKQKSEGTGKTPVPWESVLDLSVHKKPCDSEGKEFKENHLAQPAAKKKKPTTRMLQKVLLNEYNGVSLPTETTPEVTRSPSPCKSPDTQPDPELGPDSSCSVPTAESPPEVVGPSSPPLQTASLSSGQLPPLLTPTEPSSPPPRPPVLTVATPPPPLLPTVPLSHPSSDASPQQCPSPFSNTTAQSPLPILSPTVSPSPSPIPPVEPLMSAASPGPPTLSSSSSSSSSFSSSSCSSTSPSPPPLSAVSSVVSSGDNLEASLPAITFKQEESENEGLKPKEEAPPAGGQSVVQETFSKNFVCNVCESPFLSIKDLTKHLSVHAEEWPFKCEFCVQLFKVKTDLSEHRFLLHGVGNIFVCSVCKKEFAFLCNLQQHQRDLHPDEVCTHHEFESGTLRPQNFTDPSKANVEHMPSLPEEPLETSREEELNDSSEELYTTIKIMASGIKTKDPDVRLGLNQHYPSFKPPPFQYHHRNPMGIGVTATNFTTHNIPQTFTTAIRCTKCGKGVDNMPELHKHILACASASDKKRYTPKKNPVPLKQTVQPKNGVVVLDNSGKNAFRRMGQPKRLSFNVELGKMSPNKLKLSALKKKNQLVQKAILQKNRAAKQKADLRDTSEASSHICPYCDREFTYIGSLNKHAAFSCPKKPLSPSKRKVSHSSKKGGHASSSSSDRSSSSNPRRRTADTEIKMQSTQAPLGKTRARSTGPAQASLPASSFRSRQNVKFAASVKSKKASSSSLRNSSPIRMAKITHVEGKKSKAVAKSHSAQLSSKSSRSLHVRVQKSKAVIQSKTALASKRRTDRFIVKSRERSGGPITRSLQLAAAADLSESRREDSSARHELKDFSYSLRLASRCGSSTASYITRQCRKVKAAAATPFQGPFLKE